MRVSHAMSAPARTCRAGTELGQAAKMMTVHNCGCLPVVDDGGHLIGVITDRDVASTVASRHQNPWQLAVRDAMTKDVESCAADDPIERALGDLRPGWSASAARRRSRRAGQGRPVG